MDSLTELKHSPELGRYIIAKNDIKAGEIIFEEHPFVIGPKPNTYPICLECCCPVDGSDTGPKCKQCGWPLCDMCKNDIKLHKSECEIFTGNKVKFQNVIDSTEPCMQLDCVTPLRMLLKKKENPVKWDAEIKCMEYHENERKDTSIWKADQNNVVNYLRGQCKLNNEFTDDLIQQICGILEINSFECRMLSGFNGRCIYPKTAIMAHSCIPNTTHVILPSENFKIKVRASMDVPAGELLYATYTYTLTGTRFRQEHLKLGKFFTCHCKRCIDPTELGTHFSSFKCNKCDLGLITSSDPLRDDVTWNCSHCEFKTSDTAIYKALSVIQAEIDMAQEMEMGPDKLQMYETLLKKYRSVLHPRHYLQTNLKQGLIEMYGRVSGYEIDELPDILLERKLTLCEDILKVLNIIEPGKTRTRALLLYEMHTPILLMAKTAFTAGILTGEPLKERLEKVLSLLDECISILEWEDPVSAEGTLVHICKNAKEQIVNSIKSI